MRASPRRLFVTSAACGVVLAGAAAPALADGTPSSGGSGVNYHGPRSVVRDSASPWTARAPRVASAPKSKPVHARVYLMPNDEAGLERAVAAVSDPSSPSYGQYISPAQFRTKYGPGTAAVAKVTSWLRDQGLRVSSPQANGRYLDVAGTVGAVQQAFAQELSLYRRGAGTYVAPAGELSVPTGLSPYVLTVTGLDESPALITPKTSTGLLPGQRQARAAEKKQPSSAYPAGYRNAPPCSVAYGQLPATHQADNKKPLPTYLGRVWPYAVCGYTPDQLRKAYGAPGNLTGRGVTVAIIDAYMSPTLLADANRYAQRHGGKPFAAGQFTALVPEGGYSDEDVCDAGTWSAEQSLDVEAVHGFAPDANVLYIAGRSCSATDLFLAEMKAVDDNRASIVSISYGGYESAETAGAAAIETYLLQQAALQGIGFYVASGDDGDAQQATGTKQVGTSANNSYVTAVGGTSLALSRTGGYWWEAGWGTKAVTLAGNERSWSGPATFLSGSGGGRSTLFDRPDYQRGVVGGRGRAVPDVSMLGDPNTGMTVGFTQAFPDGVYYDELRAGGTSLSTPLFAAVQALTSEAQNKRLGFANPRIYALERRLVAGAKDAPDVFHDPTQALGRRAVVRADYADGVSAKSGLIYSVRTLGDDSSLNTRVGWDPVTGVGSPNAAYYAATGR